MAFVPLRLEHNELNAAIAMFGHERPPFFSSAQFALSLN